MASQKEFFYVRVVDGNAVDQLLSAAMAQAVVPEFNAPVDSLTNDALEELGLRRIVRLPYPVDGYNYAPTQPELRDGNWVMGWEQQPTPGRDERMAEMSRAVRLDRNAALAQCDWTQMADAPLLPEQRAAWTAHRQALRDLTAQESFPWQVTWPVAPT